MKMKKRIDVLLMALVLAVGLIGCKDTLKSIVHKASGTSDECRKRTLPAGLTRPVIR